MLEWLIVGGGIHGTYVANLLTHQPDLSPEQVAILDPQDRLLEAWNRMTTHCGMRFLRSPATHHIDLPILSIYRFAKTPAGRPLADFIPPYNRPSLALFRAHSDQVIEASGLARRHIRGRALAVRRDGPRLAVETTLGSVKTRRVLLAIGMGEQLCWPPWARDLRQAGGPVVHVFAPDFQADQLRPAQSIVVVGGGITAVQTALTLAAEASARVTLLVRRPLQESQFDFNPCWIGPKCLRRFYREDFPTRRATIAEARLPGSLPGEVLAEFNHARTQSRVGFRQAAVQGADLANDTVRIRTAAGVLDTHKVVLATGFRTERPGGRLVDRLVEDFRLPCNPCGYPIVGPDLQWGANIYLTGPLAELQIGPCARNIVGARNAGRLLTASLKST